MRISDWSSDVCSSDLRIGGSSSTIKIFGGVIASPGRVAQFLGPDPPVRAMLRKCSDASRCGEAKAVHRMHGPADPRSSYRASPFRPGVESRRCAARQKKEAPAARPETPETRPLYIPSRRSEKRRVGQGCASTLRTRWYPDYKTKT